MTQCLYNYLGIDRPPQQGQSMAATKEVRRLEEHLEEHMDAMGLN